MKLEIKADEKPIATASVISENPENGKNFPGVMSANSVVVRRNETPLSRSIKLILVAILTASSIWMAIWIVTRFAARKSFVHTKVQTQLVLNRQTCGWAEYDEGSNSVVFMVNALKFKGIIVDYYSEKLEVIIPMDRNTETCYVLPMQRSLTFNENDITGVVPYLQERGLHKFIVQRNTVNHLDLCEVGRNLCRGWKLAAIQPIAWREKKSFISEEDEDVVEILLV